MISNNSPSSDEDENVQVVTDGNKASRSADPKSSKKLIPKQEADQSKNACIRFIRNYPIVFVIILSILIICVVLAIVLPLTLVKPKSERAIKPRCPDGKYQARIECLPDKNNLVQAGTNLETACKQRGCCWSATPDGGGPNCAYHSNFGFRQTKVKESGVNINWYELTRMEAPAAMTRSDIANLEFKLEMQTDYRLRIKIFPRRNYKNKQQRWEVPSGIIGENIHRRKYRIEYSDAPFSFRILRNSTNTVLFDTTESSLIFSDQFLQLTTRLASPYVFGIGEVNKEGFMHDINYKSLPLFASMNHPNIAKDKINLYSQFPSYLNIEPDGRSHLVVFYNSNPSEFYLTPFPSLTYRAIGGIFDIYIFMGPTPIQAIEQFQQAFGLPKLPPYWSMGLQIGAKQYNTSVRLNRFLNRFRQARVGFDSVLVGAEHMVDATMFTLDEPFHDINNIVDRLRVEHRATVLQLLPAVGNNTQNYPFSEGVSREKYWILENFFSSGVVGKILGRNVVYPDFSLEKTREWWAEAIGRYFFTDATVKFDGIFMDFLTPVDETENKTCPNNKWNNPSYKYDFIPQPISNGTICMDSRYDITKQYNMHGVYSHFAIETTAKALDVLIHNRSLIMARHGFLGTGRYAAKWLGEYDSRWEDFRKSIINMVELSMFGFQQAGSDMCGYSGEYEYELCENWIKASGMSPFMKLIVESGQDDDTKFRQMISNGLFEVFNSSICLRYSLLPYLYTQYFKSTKHGTPVVRPLAFEFPTDVRSFQVNNQWMWGNKLMVAVGTQGTLSSIYVPREDWYDYYRGYLVEGRGDMVSTQTRRNETNLLVRAGSVIFKQDCALTAVQSAQTFIDIIIALNRTDNFTARGELFIDDSTRKNSQIKDNYHRLIEFDVYRKDNDGIIEVKKANGRYLTKLAYRDLIIYGLRSKPTRITVNENTQAIDGAKTVWDEQYSVYYVNLQTEVKRKVLLDTEYLSFRWSGGFEYGRTSNGNQMQMQQSNNNFADSGSMNGYSDFNGYNNGFNNNGF